MRRKPRYVYFAAKRGRNAIKIGIAVDVEQRMRTLGCEAFAVIDVGEGKAKKLELRIHRTLSHLRLPQTMFTQKDRPMLEEEGSTEWFKPSYEVFGLAADLMRDLPE